MWHYRARSPELLICPRILFFLRLRFLDNNWKSSYCFLWGSWSASGVSSWLRIKQVVGLGDGAGGNIITRFRMYHPSRVYGIFTFNNTAEVSMGRFMEGLKVGFGLLNIFTFSVYLVIRGRWKQQKGLNNSQWMKCKFTYILFVDMLVLSTLLYILRTSLLSLSSIIK